MQIIIISFHFEFFRYTTFLTYPYHSLAPLDITSVCGESSSLPSYNAGYLRFFHSQQTLETKLSLVTALIKCFR